MGRHRCGNSSAAWHSEGSSTSTATGQRSTWQDEEGFLDVATWEPTDELALPDRGALAKIVNADVERMATTDTGRGMLMVAGVSELAVMRPSVGRPRLWSDHELLALAREFLEHGDHWTSDHACWARKRGLERRNVLKLLRRAEAAGFVTSARVVVRPAQTLRTYRARAGASRCDGPRRVASQVVVLARGEADRTGTSVSRRVDLAEP